MINFPWFGKKKSRRRRKPKKEKSKWLDGVLSSVKKTNRRKLRSTVRTGTVKKKIDNSGWYQAFLKSRLFNIILMMIVGYMVYLTGREALVNYYQSKQVARIEAENAKIRQGNEELFYLLEYYKTDTFVELEARKHLNLKKSGEKVAIIPVDLNETNFAKPEEEEENLVHKPNYKKWWDFVFADISQLPNSEE